MRKTILAGLLSAGTVVSSPIYAENNSAKLEDIVSSNYEKILTDIDKQRKVFQIEYESSKQEKIVRNAQHYLFEAITEKLIPEWYGTAWEFNGTTNKPRSGEIACGQFVSTILKHAGFNLERIALGRLHSGNIILNMTDNPKNVRIYQSEKVTTVEDDIQEWGKGVYIVGMDTHAGIVVNDGNKVNFIHSSYYPPMKVVKEPLKGKNPLNDSKYRVFGKLLDEEMVKRWILGEKFSIKYHTANDYQEYFQK